MAKTPNIDLRDALVGNNLLINGDFRFSQRGGNFNSPASGTYNLDRMLYSKVGPMAHNILQDTDVPTLAQSGFVFQNSLRMNLVTPDDSIAAGDFTHISQVVEGYNFAKIAQKPFTLSFWVKAAVTGIYCVSFGNSGSDRSYVTEYTVNSSNTWEYKTITVSSSPVAGTWNYTNGIGLRVRWVLSCGSTFATTANTWQTGNFFATSNQVNATATGATDFRITGIMINEGSEALPFSLAGISHTNELMLCQRYYTTSGSAISPAISGFAPAASALIYYTTFSYNSGNVASSVFPFPIEMRTSPTVTTLNNVGTAGTVMYAPNGGSMASATTPTLNITTKFFNLSSGGMPTNSTGCGYLAFIANSEF